MLSTTLYIMILTCHRVNIRKHRYADRMKEHPNVSILTKNFMRNVKTPRRLKGRLPQAPDRTSIVYANEHILFKTL